MHALTGAFSDLTQAFKLMFIFQKISDAPKATPQATPSKNKDEPPAAREALHDSIVSAVDAPVAVVQEEADEEDELEGCLALSKIEIIKRTNFILQSPL